MTEVSLEQLRQAINFIKEVDSIPLEEIIWLGEDGTKHIPTKELIEYWRYVGLSNKYFAEDHYLSQR